MSHDPTVTHVDCGCGTELDVAAENGHTSTVRVLLASGCYDAASHIALHWAAINGHFAVVDAFISHAPAKTDFVCNYELPLLRAAEHGYDDIVRVLLDSGHVGAYLQNALC